MFLWLDFFRDGGILGSNEDFLGGTGSGCFGCFGRREICQQRYGEESELQATGTRCPRFGIHSEPYLDPPIRCFLVARNHLT